MTNKEAIAAFIKAQSEMGKATKSATNPFHRSKYADLETVLDVVTEPFNNNGFALMQTGGSDETGKYILTKLTHTSGGEFESKIYLVDQFKDKDDNLWPLDMQHLGSAITYAKRYGLQALTGLATEDDDGNSTMRQNVVKKPPPPKQQPKKIDQEAAHDEAVREEQNREPVELEYKEEILTALQNCKETWQCDKVVQEYYDKFKLIQKYSQEMAEELQAFYNVRFAQIKEGK